MASFGEQLRDALERRRMDQGDLAALMDVSVRAVNDWVNDRTLPRNRMGALKAWAPELGGEEIDPNEAKLSSIDGLDAAQLAKLVEAYRAIRNGGSRPPQERAG